MCANEKKRIFLLRIFAGYRVQYCPEIIKQKENAMIDILRTAAKQCFNDWQLQCNLRGSLDIRLPMFQEMMLKLQDHESDKMVRDFLEERDAVERMEGALHAEFQRRYLQKRR